MKPPIFGHRPTYDLKDFSQEVQDHPERFLRMKSNYSRSTKNDLWIFGDHFFSITGTYVGTSSTVILTGERGDNILTIPQFFPIEMMRKLEKGTLKPEYEGLYRTAMIKQLTSLKSHLGNLEKRLGSDKVQPLGSYDIQFGPGIKDSFSGNAHEYLLLQRELLREYHSPKKDS